MDYQIEDFELENEVDVEDFELAEVGIEDFGVDVVYKGTVKQIYIGDEEPTDPEILIWIDTSGETPITGTQLLTADNLQFKTSDNKVFVLNEIIPNVLLTKDNKEFIEANNKKFVLKEEI